MRRQPPPRLDPVIHPTNRLLVCASLAPAVQVEFSALQQTVGLSASALSKQVHVLIDAGYVSQARDVVDSRRIWLRLTPAGRKAYRSHLAALQAVIDTSGDVEIEGVEADLDAGADLPAGRGVNVGAGLGEADDVEAAR